MSKPSESELISKILIIIQRFSTFIQLIKVCYIFEFKIDQEIYQPNFYLSDKLNSNQNSKMKFSMSLHILSEFFSQKSA